MPVQQNTDNKEVKTKYLIILYSNDGNPISYWISEEKPREGLTTGSISFYVNKKSMNIEGNNILCEEFEVNELEKIKAKYGLIDKTNTANKDNEANMNNSTGQKE
jgi:hypothetical protein